MSANFRKASDLVSVFFDGISSDEMNQSMSFIRGWKNTVGDKIAAHSKIIDLDKGFIIVEVDHPGWSQQILLQKKRIISTLSRSFPELYIKNLQIRVVTECTTPYKKQKSEVGEGISRVSVEETDVPMNKELPDELKEVLARLKDSIKQGKPKS